TVTGTSADKRASRQARSASSSGMNRICAGPPTRNQVRSLRAWFGNSRPRSCGILALSSAVRSGKLMGLLVVPGLVPGIHDLNRNAQDVDGRDKPRFRGGSFGKSPTPIENFFRGAHG